jgi:hypothetical protein
MIFDNPRRKISGIKSVFKIALLWSRSFARDSLNLLGDDSLVMSSCHLHQILLDIFFHSFPAIKGIEMLQLSFFLVKFLLPLSLRSYKGLKVDDLALIIQQWIEKGSPGWIPADVKKDGRIDILDIPQVVSYLE